MGRVFTTLQRPKDGCLEALSSRFACWTKPLRTSLPLSALTDLGRSKSELIAENVLLRQQLIVLRREMKRPPFTRTDRILLVLLARLVRTWQQALLLVQPDTLLRWHREFFRLYWKRKSKTSSHTPKVAAETIALIREMATNNRLWGAERIRGELLKLGIHVCKRTIQKYMRNVRTQQPRGQKWSTFLRNHAANIWACDFLQVTDLFFRPLFAFFLIELKTRRVIHVGVTRSPTDAWVAQQLREATPYGQAPKYLIRDNDGKFGSCFLRVAASFRTDVPSSQDNLLCSRQHHMKLLVILLSSTKLHRSMPIDGRIRLKDQLLTLPQPGQRGADTRVVADQADRYRLMMMAGQRSHFGQLPIRLDRAKKLRWMIRSNRECSRYVFIIMKASFFENKEKPPHNRRWLP